MNSPIYLSGDEVGLLKKLRARRAAKGKGRHPVVVAQPTQQAPRRRIIEPKLNLAKVKIFPLGAASTVAAGATEFTFSQTAQNPFEPIRGIAQATTSLDDIEFSQLDCGNVSQLVVKNARFPGQMLSPQADDVLCDLDMIPGGITFSMQGFNLNAGAQRVAIGYFGNYFMSVNLRG